MSDNISKKSSFKKKVSKDNNDNNDKDKSIIKDKVGKNNILVNSLSAKVYLTIECQ